MSDVYDWLAGQSDKVIETSCAWVFLQGERALKLKKPVDYGFLDFSTPQKRLWASQRELRGKIRLRFGQQDGMLQFLSCSIAADYV